MIKRSLFVLLLFFSVPQTAQANDALGECIGRCIAEFILVLAFEMIADCLESSAEPGGCARSNNQPANDDNSSDPNERPPVNDDKPDAPDQPDKFDSAHVHGILAAEDLVDISRGAILAEDWLFLARYGGQEYLCTDLRNETYQSPLLILQNRCPMEYFERGVFIAAHSIPDNCQSDDCADIQAAAIKPGDPMAPDQIRTLVISNGHLLIIPGGSDPDPGRIMHLSAGAALQ